jgi:energy-coupling factor transport system ATP-binding protein
MGASDAGKSTLLCCFNGLIPNFTKGHYQEVFVCCKNLKEERVGTLTKGIGLVFQDIELQLFSTNTLLKLAFCPETFVVSKEEIEDRIHSVCKNINLEGFDNREPAHSA